MSLALKDGSTRTPVSLTGINAGATLVASAGAGKKSRIQRAQLWLGGITQKTQVEVKTGSTVLRSFFPTGDVHIQLTLDDHIISDADTTITVLATGGDAATMTVDGDVDVITGSNP